MLYIVVGSIEARRAIASFMNHPDAPLTENVSVFYCILDKMGKDLTIH